MNASNEKLKLYSEVDKDYFYQLRGALYFDDGYFGSAKSEVSEESKVSGKTTSVEEAVIKVGDVAEDGQRILEGKARKNKKVLMPLLAASLCVVLLCVAGIVFLKRAGYFPQSSQLHFDSEPAGFAVEEGKKIPLFKGFVLDPDGQGVSLSNYDHVGQTVVLLAWRSDEPESVEFLRELTQIQARAAAGSNSKLVFVGINLDERKTDALRMVVKTHSYDWQHIWDWDPRNNSTNRPSVSLGIVETPAIYVIDPLSRLKYSGLEPADVVRVLEAE